MKNMVIFIIVSFFLLFCSGNSLAGTNDIYIIKVSGAISPAQAEFVIKGINKASDEGGHCIVIELDTPGGLAESMRGIVMAIFGSKTPVVVYVSPGGARAASAGVMITMAADIAAMAPGTNIGAAHPVSIGGKEINKTMSEKVINDMVAYTKSIAKKRGRNIKWAEDVVRESVSITETEALKENVIDIIAKDIDDLIRQINGLEVEGKGILTLDGAGKKILNEDLRTKILKVISDPSISYILLMIGLAGLYFELSHPGAVFPGVVGAICLILAFFAMQTLPVNYAGILLILLSLVLFILEMKITSYGLLSVAGVVSLLLGSLMLFESDGSGLRVSLQVILPTTMLVSGFFIVVAGLVFKSHMAKPLTGAKGLIGETGIVKKEIANEGKVFVHGELWNAVSKKPITKGTKIRVVKVDNLVLEVDELQT